jgi:hypothetical protein
MTTVHGYPTAGILATIQAHREMVARKE